MGSWFFYAHGCPEEECQQRLMGTRCTKNICAYLIIYEYKDKKAVKTVRGRHSLLSAYERERSLYSWSYRGCMCVKVMIGYKLMFAILAASKNRKVGGFIWRTQL